MKSIILFKKSITVILYIILALYCIILYYVVGSIAVQASAVVDCARSTGRVSLRWFDTMQCVTSYIYIYIYNMGTLYVKKFHLLYIGVDADVVVALVLA